MKGLIISCLAFFSLGVHAQQIPAWTTGTVITVPCPNDSTQTVKTFQGWEVYQTLDNDPDGPRDTTRCINLIYGDSWRQAKVKLSEVNPDLDLFIRAHGFASPLAANDVYVYNHLEVQPSSPVINMADTCIYGTCSSFQVGIRVPDPLGTGYTYRYHENGFAPDLCLPTERFVNGNFLDDLLFRFSFNATNIQGDSILIRIPYFEASWGGVYQTDDQSDLQNYRSGNDISLYWERVLVMYTDTSYPGPGNLSYVEFTPVPNTSVPTAINISIGYYADLVFQPYAAIRGGLPVGDTINRHPVNIINNGGNMCMTNIVEKRFEKDAFYEHHSGYVSFEGKRSCFFFGLGGKLKVADGATMNYGYNGRGMMALATGGTIEIGNDAELVMAGGITMMEYDWEDSPQQIYMELNPGSKLTFAPGSHIDNKRSKDGSMKLNIYMNGGILDMSGLPPEQRQLINPIYPEAQRELSDNIKLGPNPFTDVLHISLTSAREKSCTYELYDLQGQRIFSELVMLRQGINQLELHPEGLQQGTYILKVTEGGSVFAEQLVKLE